MCFFLITETSLWTIYFGIIFEKLLQSWWKLFERCNYLGGRGFLGKKKSHFDMDKVLSKTKIKRMAKILPQFYRIWKIQQNAAMARRLERGVAAIITVLTRPKHYIIIIIIIVTVIIMASQIDHRSIKLMVAMKRQWPDWTDRHRYRIHSLTHSLIHSPLKGQVTVRKLQDERNSCNEIMKSFLLKNNTIITIYDSRKIWWFPNWPQWFE